jgi:hypothetical protein
MMSERAIVEELVNVRGGNDDVRCLGVLVTPRESYENTCSSLSSRTSTGFEIVSNHHGLRTTFNDFSAFI